MARRMLPPAGGKGSTVAPIASTRVPADLTPTVAPRRRGESSVAPRQPAVLKPAPGCTIRTVCVVKGDADDVAFNLRQMGCHPRVYERCARAENITVSVWIVVCDADELR
jgi:hypothetical protein